LSLAGCQSGHIPNPNDPEDVGAVSPDTLRRNLGAVTDSLANRYASGELTGQEYRDYVTKAATELLAAADPDGIKPEQAWEYAEVLRDAKEWKEAEPVLRIAVKYAKTTHNEDRRINDSLRLAVAQANLGQVAEAIKTTRGTFDAQPKDSAPVLVAVLLEIVPAARGKGHDLELAKLLEDAVTVHMHAKVDPNSDAGRAFLMARPYHVSNAWGLASELYHSAGRDDLAAVARRKRAESGSAFAPNRVGA